MGDAVDSLGLGDVELTYQLCEGGERVVLVHASAFVSWYDPLAEQLMEYSTLRYRRRLRESDSGGYRGRTVAEDAAICVRLMDHVGWDTAHVVGHSYGALVALHLATENPERVGTVALLEPAVRGISSSEQVTATVQPVIAAYRSGDKAAAVDGFLRHVCGDGYRAVLDRMTPHAFDEALDEADLFFRSEMPAVQQWSFGAGAAGRVSSPHVRASTGTSCSAQRELAPSASRSAVSVGVTRARIAWRSAVPPHRPLPRRRSAVRHAWSVVLRGWRR